MRAHVWGGRSAAVSLAKPVLALMLAQHPPAIAPRHEGLGVPSKATVSPHSAHEKGSGGCPHPLVSLAELLVNFTSGGISLEELFSSGMPGKRRGCVWGEGIK